MITKDLCLFLNILEHYQFSNENLPKIMEGVIEWLLFNAYSRIVQLLHDHGVHWIFIIVLAHWNNSLQIDMSPHSDTLSRFHANQSLLFLFNAVCIAEKQQIPIL